MSKTNKTRPWRVRVTERPMQTCVPVHDHRDGGCTLPDDPRDGYGRNWGARDCYWALGPTFLYGKGGGCGCHMCTGYEWRRRERRANRRTARQVSRGALAAYHGGGIDDYDEYVPPSPMW